MRALIDASRSLETTSSPAMTCWTNSPIMSLARSTWLSLRARRPSSRIWESRSRSSRSSRTTTFLPFSGLLLLMGFLFVLVLFRLRLVQAQRIRQLLLGVRILHHALEQLLEAIVAVGLGQQVPELLARVDELTERLDLLHHVVRLEVLEAVEPQLDVHLPFLVGQLVVHTHRQPRCHSREYLIEVVAIDLDDLPILDPR